MGRPSTERRVQLVAEARTWEKRNRAASEAGPDGVEAPESQTLDLFPELQLKASEAQVMKHVDFLSRKSVFSASQRHQLGVQSARMMQVFEDTLAAGEVRMDLARHRVTRNDREVRLGPTEFRLLRHFLEHPDRVFSREQLLDAVWGSDIFVDPRTVDASIRRLRKTLNDAGESDLVRTVRAAGYAFESSAGTYAS